MDNKKGWVLVIGVLLILGVGMYAMVTMVESSVQRTVSPVQDMTGYVSTQVASFLHPTPTVLPDPVSIIHSVRSLARLETIQYSVEKVITAESGQGTFGFLFGDRLLLVAHGVVIAGIDLGQLRPEDMRMDQGVLYVTLPAAQVFVATLDNDKSYVYDRDTGALTHGNMNLETEARRAAEAEIEKTALEDGILEKARQNGESYLSTLLRRLGYPEVIFESRPLSATPTP
jgi:hypothetical protein